MLCVKNLIYIYVYMLHNSKNINLKYINLNLINNKIMYKLRQFILIYITFILAFLLHLLLHILHII